MTREWPPDIYGGAGVHVEHLVEQLRNLIDVDVLCFGDPKPGAHAYAVPSHLAQSNPALQTVGINLEMVKDLGNAQVVHSHTWYANLAGHFAKSLFEIPHVVTAHSLEPRRPWKAEQLGSGYALSSWAERTAYENADAIIAVSNGMKADILDCYPMLDDKKLHVVYNGIDTTVIAKTENRDVLIRHGIDPNRPYVLFVGRITRQKGIMHLLRAIEQLPEEIAVVLCASSPDTPELGQEVAAQIEKLSTTRSGVHWIQEQLPRPELIDVLSGATVFACPSIYEPLGIVNLEAMACELPVVASDVGGIPEVVVDGVTGHLVHYDAEHAKDFENGIASAIQQIFENPTQAKTMGLAGRKRAVEEFGWDRIAKQTIDIYQGLLH
mgnify:CR=1 FL=1